MAGEMTKADIEEGGDYYESRVALEEFVKKSGFNCVVKPFDVYQGPYAQISSLHLKTENLGTLWLSSESEDSFIYRLEQDSDPLEVDDSDSLFFLLMDAYHLNGLPVSVLQTYSVNNEVAADLDIDGEVWKGLKVGSFPNKGNLQISSISDGKVTLTTIDQKIKYQRIIS